MESVEEKIRAKGLKVTRPRRLVFQTLLEQGGHWSVDDIVAQLDKEKASITRMSVYNAIDALTASGLVMVADAGPGRALYEVNEVWHHHFVCRQCGSIQDIACVKGTKPCLLPPKDIGVVVDEAQVIFRGICKTCLGDGV